MKKISGYRVLPIGALLAGCVGYDAPVDADYTTSTQALVRPDTLVAVDGPGVAAPVSAAADSYAYWTSRPGETPVGDEGGPEGVVDPVPLAAPRIGVMDPVPVAAPRIGVMESPEGLAGDPQRDPAGDSMPASSVSGGQCGGDHYLIKRGRHYSVSPLNIFARIPAHLGTSVTHAFSFDDGARYTTRNPSNQGDTNKLWGFTDCGAMDPQNNSARFGWRWDPALRKIEIMAYVDHGTHYFASLGYTDPNECSEGTIELVGTSKYRFKYKGKEVLMDRFCSSDRIRGSRLYPYFGGDETAPNDVNIRLQRR